MRAWKRAMLLPWTNKVNYTQIVQQIAAANLIAYWPLAEAAGATVALDASGNGCNGAYTAVTLGVAGIGDGRTAASFDGSTSFNNIYSASLQTVFNGGEGTVALWIKVSGAGVWTDGVQRRFFRLSTTGTDFMYVRKDTTNGQMLFNYAPSGASKSVTVNSLSSVGWLHIAMTWSKSADQMKAYINATQQGSTQTGLGDWVGTLLSNTATMIGAADTTPNNVWSGSIAHAAIWTTPLSAAQILTLVAVP